MALFRAPSLAGSIACNNERGASGIGDRHTAIPADLGAVGALSKEDPAAAGIAGPRQLGSARP